MKNETFRITLIFLKELIAFTKDNNGSAYFNTYK